MIRLNSGIDDYIYKKELLEFREKCNKETLNIPFLDFVLLPELERGVEGNGKGDVLAQHSQLGARDTYMISESQIVQEAPFAGDLDDFNSEALSAVTENNAQ
jgi:hypothetical protein